ncbi:MAG: cytochrome P450, partial [Pseudomonadota bacterium]
LGAFLPLPGWAPRGYPRAARDAAAEIRGLIAEMCRQRQADIAAGTAPQDLATKIMTTPDPQTGQTFSTGEMVDQVAIFFLAGHETSASVLAWALYLLATHADFQEKVADEAAAFAENPSFAALSTLPQTRNVFREALRLYPPVPMMVRETTRAETFRKRALRRGAQIVISPWHLHRHTAHWHEADEFDPDRWDRAETQASQRDAYLPFSAGQRVCPGAGFAMAEGVVMLAVFVSRWAFSAGQHPVPRPVAHLTLRSRDGIWLDVAQRAVRRDAVPSDPPARKAG